MYKASLAGIRLLEKQISKITSDWSKLGVPDEAIMITVNTDEDGLNEVTLFVRKDYLHLLDEEK